MGLPLLSATFLQAGQPFPYCNSARAYELIHLIPASFASARCFTRSFQSVLLGNEASPMSKGRIP